MYADRLPLYRRLAAERASKVIALVNGDRPGMETHIHPDVLDYFVQHLDRIGVVRRISLFLYTCGGDTLAAWSIVGLLRQFCDEQEVVVPGKARSSGTLICLGADSIVMTKQATLGPIDPSVNGTLNPPDAVDPRFRVPVGVEEINGFVEFARSVHGGSEAGMIVKALYDDIQAELELTTPFDANLLLGPAEAATYRCCRGLLESVEGGSHAHLDGGTLRRTPRTSVPRGLQNEKDIQGWHHVV